MKKQYNLLLGHLSIWVLLTPMRQNAIVYMSDFAEKVPSGKSYCCETCSGPILFFYTVIQLIFEVLLAKQRVQFLLVSEINF